MGDLPTRSYLRRGEHRREVTGPKLAVSPGVGGWGPLAFKGYGSPFGIHPHGGAKVFTIVTTLGRMTTPTYVGVRNRARRQTDAANWRFFLQRLKPHLNSICQISGKIRGRSIWGLLG